MLPRKFCFWQRFLFALILATACVGPVMTDGEKLHAQTEQNSSGSMRLRLRNNAFGVGKIVASKDNETIGWLNEGFAEPFFFQTSAVRSITAIEVPQSDQPGQTNFLVEAKDGQCVVGALVKLDTNVLTVRSKLLGEVSVGTSNISQLIRADYAGEVTYAGLAQQSAWTPLGNAKDWDFRAGVLTAVKQATSIVGDVKLPSKCEINLALSWKGVPDFVVSLGVNGSEKSSGQVAAAGRLEIWNRNLVLVRETEKDADLAKLTELNEKNPHIELSILMDQDNGLFLVRDMHGGRLGKIQVADKTKRIGSAIHIVNHGPTMSLERLEVRRWSGTTMLGTDQGQQVVIRDSQATDSNQLRTFENSWISQFDVQSGQFVVEGSDGSKRNVPADQLLLAGLAKSKVTGEEPVAETSASSAEKRIANLANPSKDSSSKPEESTPRTDKETVELILADRSRFKGQWLESVDGALRIRSPWFTEELRFEPTQVVSWIGPDDQFSPDLTAHRNGIIKIGDTELAGYLVEDVPAGGEQAIRWQPHGSLNSSSVKASAEGSIAYRLQLPVNATGQPTGRVDELLNQQRSDTTKAQPTTAGETSNAKSTREIVFTSGDTIDGYVERADERGVYFVSEQTKVKFVEHQRLDRVWLNSLLAASKKTANEKIQRLMTVPRSMKDDPPTQLLISVTGDLLRGRLMKLDENQVWFEVRSEVSQIPRDKVAEIIWLHQKNWGPTSDTPPVTSTNYQVHVVQQNRGLTFAPSKVSGAVLHGDSELLGNCQISIKQVSQILFGPNIDRRVAQFRENPWVLSLAQLPRAFVAKDEQAESTLGVSSPLIGKPAPTFSIVGLDGQRLKLSDFHGKTLVLDFWASWCGPCLKTLPTVSEVINSCDPDEVQLIAVNIQESDTRADAAIKKLNLDLTVGLDDSGSVATSYLATSIPQTVVIDNKGIVRFVFVGGKSTLAAELKDAIEQASKEGT